MFRFSSTPASRGIPACAHPVRGATLLSLILVLLALPSVTAARTSTDVPKPPPFYAIKNARVVTVSGGTLERATVLLADGIIEAMNDEQEQYGTERAMQFLATVADQPPQKMIDKLRADVKHFCGNQPQGDDITVLAVHLP